jgi:site-specific DNA recombinase
VEINESSVLRAITYSRVSTKAQGEEDRYSIPQQKSALRGYCDERGWRKVAEVADIGYSGAALARPELDWIRDKVAQGGVDIVLAQDADRITREPMHRFALEEEFAKHGTRLVALDDWGDDSHEGQLLKYMKGWVSKGERLKFAERTRRGKLRKAREGKVVGGHNRAYGYEWVKNTDGKVVGYAINEVEMGVVRRIFTDVASGTGIRTIKEQLDLEGVPRPSTGKTWSRPFLRGLILDDLYAPHTFDALRDIGVSDDVLITLDGDKSYGVYRFDGIPVPVPDAGVPRDVVEAARYKVKNNRSPSKSGDRFWELSGGILYCAECARRMQTFAFPRGNKRYEYYRCQSTTSGKADPCTMRKVVPAAAIEAEVWDAVRRLLDDREYTLSKVRESFDAKRRELSGPGLDAGKLARRLESLEAERKCYSLQNARGVLSDKELDEMLSEVDVQRKQVEHALQRARNQVAELEKLDEAERQIKTRIWDGYGGLDDATPQTRREVYEDLGLRVEVGEDKRLFLCGWLPIGGGITAYTEGPEPRCLFNAERPPRHHVGSLKTSR